MSYSKTGPQQKKRKISQENEDDSSDVDDPSEVDVSNSNSEEEEEGETNFREPKFEPAHKKIKSSHGYESDSDVEESIADSQKERTETNMSFEGGPPLKKIKLSSNSIDKSGQNDNLNESLNATSEQQNVVPEFDCNYENINANFYAEELTSDDEILMFQCPKNFDVEALLDKNIDLSKDTKLKDDCNKYVCQTIVNNKNKKINVVLPSREKGAVMKKLPVVGHIVLRQVLKLPKKNVGSFVDYDVDDARQPIPESMKRHPLLGIEWDDHFDKVRRQMRKHKKLLRKSLKHEKSLEKSEKERKEQKKKLKVELALLKKKQILEVDN